MTSRMIDKVQDTDLAWIAGVLDGWATISRSKEGLLSIGMASSREDRIKVLNHIRLMLMMKKPDSSRPRTEMSSIFPDGGFLRKACAIHCPEPHIHVYPRLRTVCSLRIGGVASLFVAHNCKPFIRSFPVTDILNQDGWEKRIGSSTAKSVINRLKGNGWEIPPALLRLES